MAGTRFENMHGVNTNKSFRELRRWQKERKSKVKDLSYVVPQAEKPEIEALRQNNGQPSITWIGHSSFLLQMNGMNLLTDPVWAERMGFARRLARPGLRLEDLPRIDAVLLSHGHYDHMNMPSLTALLRANRGMAAIVPTGLGGKLKRRGFSNVTELNWWESVAVGGLDIHFVPAQHWTRRTLLDMNRSHWGGYVIRPAGTEQTGQTLYFAGDSGYFSGFKEIGDRFDIRWALMPIGAYEPEWFMSNQHVNPEEALQAFIDCGAELFIPMHYGTYRLADDTPREALDRLLAEWTRLGLQPERLKLPRHGETLWE